MSGRGYYGAGQIQQRAPRRRRNWFTIVAVLGVGAAVVWLFWPRGPMSMPARAAKEPAESPMPPAPVTVVPVDPLKQLEDDARARGFSSVKDYEDSVVTSSKQLQAAGAKVLLAPHLQHLALRVGS